ncbi:MAG: phage portal protein, partial [Coriobacteriia bacterium]|nr:phage portal protein [Coriobacteriia bacterium]
MAEKRSLLDRLFGRRPAESVTVHRLELVAGYGSIFSEWAGSPYQADVVRGAVDAIARNAARLKPRHIRRAGGAITAVAGQIERVLAVRPNQHMSTFDFLYKVVTTLLVENNAFIYPEWAGGQLVAVWPISCTRAEFLEQEDGVAYVRFWFRDGKDRVLPYAELIHLRRHFFRDPLVGDDNSPLDGTLNAIRITNQGIAQAVQSSANLRGLLKFSAMLKPDDMKKQRDTFVADYLSVNSSGGVAALDSKAEYVELKGDPKMVNAAQMKELRDTVYRYFGVNEAIVTSKYTEDDWNAFYESVLEPLAVQLSLEFTAKLFTGREQGHGNEIIFESNRLQYASATTKLRLLVA